MSPRNGLGLFIVMMLLTAAVAGCGGGGGGGGATGAANPGTTSGTTPSQGGTATRGAVAVVLDFTTVRSASRATKAVPASTASVIIALRDQNTGADDVTPTSASCPAGTSQTVVLPDVASGTYEAIITLLDAAGNVLGHFCAGVTVQVGQSATITVTGTNSPSTMTVSPAAPSIAFGTSQPFSVTAAYADGSHLNVTRDSTWTSSVQAVATIATTGVAQGVTAGSSIITAMFDGVSGSTTLTVNPLTVTAVHITPRDPSIDLGGSQPFTAMGTMSNGSTQDLTATVTWDSTNKQFATIAASGIATSVAAGVTTISATFNALSDTTSLTVGPPTVTSLTIAPLAPHVAVGGTQAFTLNATYTNNSQAAVDPATATWQSSDTSLVTVTNGTAQGVRPGQVNITATYLGHPASTTLTVDYNPTTWVVRQNRESLNKVAADGAGHYVAVGNLGTVWTSPDGTTWTLVNSGTKSDLMGVCHGAVTGTFVAVGWDGTAITSTDSGATWTPASAGVPLAAVTYGTVGNGPGQNLYVAVGLDQVLTSPDGATWSPVTTGLPATTNLISAAIDSTGTVYVVGQDTNSGSATIWSSADGTTWGQPTLPVLPPASQLTGVACGSLNGNTHVVAVGWYTDQNTFLNQALLVRCTNGTWTQDASPISSANAYNMEVTFAGTQFVAVGDSSYLFDGTTWTSPGTPLDLTGNSANAWPSVAWDSFLNRVVGVGVAGHITTSTDGNTWTMLTTGNSVNITGLAYGQGQFVGVGAATILTSLDTATWTVANFPGVGLFNPTGVAYGKFGAVDAFVAIGYDQGNNVATIRTLNNGSNWTPATTVPAVPALSAVTCSNSRFVAVGTNVILTSTDGMVWTQPAVTIPATTYLSGVATDGTNFVAIGDDNGSPVVYTSPDGTTWTLVDISTLNPTPQYLNCVTWGQGLFVVGGSDTAGNPQLLTSADMGASWTPVAQALTALPGAIAFGNGHFVATAWSTTMGVNNKVILDSTDGVSWTTIDLATENDLPAIVCGNGQFVTAGIYGEILSNP